MPKGFSDRERALIGADLLAKGRELFGAHGLRKTHVEDLTRAVGISKGAFYLFYESKEALFFEILLQFEAEYRARMLAALRTGGLPPEQRLRDALRQAVTLWRAHPLFSSFGGDDMAYLARKLTPEQIEANMAGDQQASRDLIAAGRAIGLPMRATPELLTGLLRALVMLNFHADEIGPDQFPAVIEVLVEQLAAYLAKE